ncbi:MAG: hypothetical protein EB084_10175 [Proteobacteria bacterium]|nr:hypothetical protein [Pseudomonadota bacterium]
MWLVTPLAGAGPLHVDYAGTFSDVSFPGGQRVVKLLRIEVLTPVRGGPREARPTLSGVVRIRDGTSSIDYNIRNAYVTRDVSLYLATRGSSSLTVMLPDSGNGTLLFSDRPTAREVKGAPTAPSTPR